jgi:hypothetical protein
MHVEAIARKSVRPLSSTFAVRSLEMAPLTGDILFDAMTTGWPCLVGPTGAFQTSAESFGPIPLRLSKFFQPSSLA